MEKFKHKEIDLSEHMNAPPNYFPVRQYASRTFCLTSKAQ